MDVRISQKCGQSSRRFLFCVNFGFAYLSLYFLLYSIMAGIKLAIKYVLSKEIIELQLYRHIKKYSVSTEDKEQM